MEKKIITLWVNVYKFQNQYSILSGAIYDTKEKAEDSGKLVQGYVTTVAVQFSEEM